MRKKVIAFIKRARCAGRTFSDIQRYIVENLHGYDYDEKVTYFNWEKKAPINIRRYRGYWCTNLFGAFNYYKNSYRHGILRIYCKKINRKWVHKDFA